MPLREQIVKEILFKIEDIDVDVDIRNHDANGMQGSR